MSCSSLNKAVMNFFLFSITKGDGSHARALISSQATLSESVKSKVLDLIANLPVLGKQREELDELLGFASEPASSRRPPKTTAPFGTVSISNQEQRGVARALMSSDISIQVLSFLQVEELAGAMEVNSFCQKQAMHAVCYQIRCQKKFISNDVINFDKNILHLHSAYEYLRYFEKVSHLVLRDSRIWDKNGLEIDVFSAKPNGKLYWESRESVISVELGSLNLAVSMESRGVLFPSMRDLQLVINAIDPEELGMTSLLKWCPATLRSIDIRRHKREINQREVFLRSLKTLGSFSQLTNLSISAHHYVERFTSTGEFELLYSSFPNLTGLRLGSYSNGWLKDEHCKVLSSARWRLTALELPLDITFLGMKNLALAFPELTFLDIAYKPHKISFMDHEYPLPISPGLTVLARSWPKLSRLEMDAVLNVETLDLIMEGHPHLEHLEICHQGDQTQEYWQNGEGIKAIARYGSHLISLHPEGIPYTVGTLCTTLGPQCRRLQVLELRAIEEQELLSAEELQQIRLACPSAVITETG